MPGPAKLQLGYAFISDPAPIYASDSTTTNVVDVLVIVSVQTLAAVTMQQITIDISTGEESSLSISMARDLPGPSYDTSIPWTISSSGSRVTIAPQAGSSGMLTGPIVFQLPGIQVNHTPGKVKITVTEVAPPAPKVSDDQTYSLEKQPSTFQVKKFWADPNKLDTVEQPVTLHWTCTDAGQQALNGLRIASVSSVVPVGDAPAARAGTSQFKECGPSNDCYTCQDGVDGVPTGPISQTTTFALDIFETDSHGDSTLCGTVETIVQVTLPYFSGVARQDLSPSRRLATLHWLAFNAASCSVALDANPIAANAPADTYRQGYTVALGAPVGLHQLSVTANPVTGNAQVPYVFTSFDITDPVTITTPITPQYMALTPDGKYALIGAIADKKVMVFDVAARSATSATAGVSDLSSIAITPDGETALVTSLDAGAIYRLSVPSLAPVGPPVTLTAQQPAQVAITSDGKQAWVVSEGGRMNVFDVASGVVGGQSVFVGPEPMGPALTPDNSLALVTVSANNQVAVVDLAGSGVLKTIPVSYGPTVVAITPNGAWALVANGDDGTLTVIDVVNKTASATIPGGDSPVAISMTADGRYAFVADANTNNVLIVDTANWSVESFSVGVARDGSFALVGANGPTTVALV
jgi:YVTN family beta-propeller protein